MFFYKIENPALRDETIKKFLALKKRIKERYSAEAMDKDQLEYDLSKFFKPITAHSKN